MLSRAFTAVIERNVSLSGDFWTEPYETAWAAEVRWFIHVLEADRGATLRVGSDISPEGLTWCPHEAPPVALDGPGLLSLPLNNVGPWLRLNGRVEGPEGARVKAIIYLTLRG
ncbi:MULTISPECIES: hypothetical protein [unclassified Chelatococcus]|uniref:hypothetical protein n=1 Tax=unclassified Chelatococcus TaxID=2638111 RepID=UPI001BD02E95|nr:MULTISPECIES: hypothetical protein [unclassified Chelatococcus]MBS7699742.1 hypothetical protein [Chelatococcus sp. YT9]MBX3558088.1 hypothetical protein [Chelatococcus sp.]